MSSYLIYVPLSLSLYLLFLSLLLGFLVYTYVLGDLNICILANRGYWESLLMVLNTGLMEVTSEIPPMTWTFVWTAFFGQIELRILHYMVTIYMSNVGFKVLIVIFEMITLIISFHHNYCLHCHFQKLNMFIKQSRFP